MSPDTTPVSVPVSVSMNKTQAVRLLKARFLNPQIAERTTPEDAAAGIKRVSVFASGPYGSRVGVVEVSGPPQAVYKAAVKASYRRLGLDVEFSEGAVKLTPLPVAAPTPAT